MESVQSTEPIYSSYVEILAEMHHNTVWRVSRSVTRKCYHARKRSDDTPLKFLYPLNVEAIQVKIAIREEKLAVKREYAKQYIATIDDRNLAKQLPLL